MAEVMIGGQPHKTVFDQRGAGSAVIAADTSVVNGQFNTLVVIRDCVFTSFVRANTTGSFGSNIIPAGTLIVGNISSFQLASGLVMAYGD